jgi:uncharacterized protein YndB with AHSA1/START domain
MKRHSSRSFREVTMKRMPQQSDSFTASFRVRRSPEAVYAAINDVRSWWTGKITGPTDQLGQEFVYRYEDIHRSTQRVTELVPGKKVAWEVTDARLGSFDNPIEWNGTRIEFALTPSATGTEVRFTHHGLVPACQCYRGCAEAWTYLVTNSLKRRITQGKSTERAA